jgi:MarR family transcriptional regulator for hemolysin
MNKPLSQFVDSQTSETVQERFGKAIGEVGRAWRAKLDQRLKPLGLSQSKWRALLYVSRAPQGINQTDLARMLGIEAPTATRLLNQLEEAGWVKRRILPEDARVKMVQVTAKAKKIIVRIDLEVGELRAETVGRLTDQQAAAGLAAIQELQRLLESV